MLLKPLSRQKSICYAVRRDLLSNPGCHIPVPILLIQAFSLHFVSVGFNRIDNTEKY